jgi:hypothetical protein
VSSNPSELPQSSIGPLLTHADASDVVFLLSYDTSVGLGACGLYRTSFQTSRRLQARADVPFLFSFSQTLLPSTRSPSTPPSFLSTEATTLPRPVAR